MVRGRYMFRVDDVVRPGGCSNKTGGTCKSCLKTHLTTVIVFCRSYPHLPEHCQHAWRDDRRRERHLPGPDPDVCTHDRTATGNAELMNSQPYTVV